MTLATTASRAGRSPLRHLPVLAAALAAIAVVLLALGPIGWRAGWWHFRFAFQTLMPWAAYCGIAALAVSAWYMRKTRLPALKTADVFAPAVALGHGIGRLGCFSAGCCWGVECHLPWAVTFTNPVANQLVGVFHGPAHTTKSG